jgi:steroid delta-isomerase-like uncharacterized protein
MTDAEARGRKSATMSEPGNSCEAQNLRLVHEVVAAWNDHDPDRYAALLDDTVVAESHDRRDPVCGRAAARKLMQAWCDAFPDLHFTVNDMVASGERVFASWLATGTPRDLRRPTPLSAHGCLVVTLKHGAIVHTWTYWDSAELHQRLGE